MNRFELSTLVRENIKNIQPYSSARDEYKETNGDMVFLDANENPFPNAVNRYPDPQQREVKTLLAEQKGVNAANILLGNGSDEVLDLIFRAFCEPNIDKIMILPPTYGMYKVLANINAVEIQEVVLTSGFQPDVTAILSAVSPQTKLLFLCSPNNPTGNSFSETAVATLLKQFSGIVIIDEAYIDFSTQESWLDRLETYPNLIVTQTLSKAYGLAGIRLGVCYASAQIIRILNSIKPPYNINQLTQNKAIERLQDIERVAQEVHTIQQEKEKLIQALNTMPFITKIYPSDANFILLEVDNADKRYQQLIQKGIVVRNRTKEPLCTNCLRITVGTTIENQQLINTLQELS